MSTRRKTTPSRAPKPLGPTDALADFATFGALSAVEKRAVAQAIAEELGADFRAGEALVGEAALASVFHVPSGSELVLVPGGSFWMGFTDDDQAAVDACFEGKEDAAVRKAVKQTIKLMSPVHEVTLRPFALARLPVSAPDIVATLLGHAAGPDLSREDASAILERWDFRFPSEAEWEYVAREGRGLSFLLDVAHTYREDAEERLETAWGVGQLGQAVWVGDRWHPSYAQAPTDGSAWTTGKGRGMYRGSFSLGLSEMQSHHELVFALTALRVEPLAKNDDTEVWLRLALGPDEDGKWRCVPTAPREETPKPKPKTPSKAPEQVSTKPGAQAAKPTSSGSTAAPPTALDQALAEPDATKAGKLAEDVLLSLGLAPDDAGLVPLREELSPALVAALARIMEERPDLPLYAVAVPAHPDVRRRWLGLSPPDVLEQSVSVEGGRAAPLWRIIAERERATPVGEEADVRALVSPTETTCAFLEIALTAGYLNARHYPTWDEIRALEPRAVPWLLTWIERRAQELARGRRVPLTDQEAFAALYPIAAAKRPIAREWTTFLPITQLDDAALIWNAVPEADREAALVDALQAAIVSTSLFQQTIDFVRRFPRPAVAEVCRAYFTSSEGKKKRGAWAMKHWLEELRKLCVEVPALRGVFDASKKRRLRARATARRALPSLRAGRRWSPWPDQVIPRSGRARTCVGRAACAPKTCSA